MRRRPTVLRTSRKPQMVPRAAYRILGTSVSFRRVIVVRERRIFRNVRLARSRRVDRCSEVVRVGVDVGSAVTERRNVLRRHRGARIRKVCKNGVMGADALD